MEDWKPSPIEGSVMRLDDWRTLYDLLNRAIPEARDRRGGAWHVYCAAQELAHASLLEAMSEEAA